jgi:hypothetical protein
MTHHCVFTVTAAATQRGLQDAAPLRVHPHCGGHSERASRCRTTGCNRHCGGHSARASRCRTAPLRVHRHCGGHSLDSCSLPDADPWASSGGLFVLDRNGSRYLMDPGTTVPPVCSSTDHCCFETSTSAGRVSLRTTQQPQLFLRALCIPSIT